MIKKYRITTWAVLFAAMAFTACTQDDNTLPAETDNALANLPGNTPVQIITMLDGKETESRAEEVKTFAVTEIHEKGKMIASLFINNGNGFPENAQFTNIEEVDFGKVDNLKDQSNNVLTLNNFPNLNEWTVLLGEKKHSDETNLTDCLLGWSQVAKHATDNKPVLVYNMKRTRAKVTLQLKQQGTDNMLCMCKGVEAAVWVKRTLTSVVPKENSYDLAIYDRVENNEKSLGWCNLSVPVKADATALNAGYEGTHSGKSNITQLTGLVYATATHELVDGTYSSISESDASFDLSQAEKAYIWVEINHGHDNQTTYPDYPHLGDNGGGTYRVDLENIDMGDGKTLKRLEAGKHYIITLTLDHNKKVTATATIGDWDKYEGSIPDTGFVDESKEGSSVTGGTGNQGGTI